MKYSAIIPAYREEKTIANAIRRTAEYFRSLNESFEIIVVDDGSPDRTGDEADRLVQEIPELNVIHRPINFGKGGAVKRGVESAQGEWILFLDADLATAPQEFSKFLPLLSTYDAVIGSRYCRGGEVRTKQPWPRVLASRVFNLFVRLYLGLPYADTQCGFKAFSSKFKPIFSGLRAKGWTFDVDLLYQAKLQNLRVIEVPIVWDDKRESRVKYSDAGQILRELRAIKHRQV